MQHHRFWVGWIVGAIYFFSLASFAGIDSPISGSVLDSDGAGVRGATIQVTTPAGVKTFLASPLTGEFRLPLTMGQYEILIQAPDYTPSRRKIEVPSGGSSGVNFVLDSEVRAEGSAEGSKVGSGNSEPRSNVQEVPSGDSEMVIEVKSKKRLIQNQTSVSSTEINREQIAQLPQGQEISLPRLLSTTTPGVVQGPFGQLFFRGNHANVQYQLDGVQMPESPSNSFGQSISPRNIDHMEVITGGIPAEFGLRLSAVVNIVTKSGPEKPQGEIELNYGSYNTISPHLIYGGSNESGSIHYFFSGNYNRTDRGLDTPQPRSYDDQGQGGKDSVHNTSTGNSEFAKIDWQVNNEDKVSFIVSNTQYHFQIPNFPSAFQPSDPFFQPGYSDPFGNGGEPDKVTFTYRPPNTDDTQSETNTYGQVVWKHIYSERSFLQLAPYYKYTRLRYQDDPVNDLYSALIGVPFAEPSTFAENRHTNNLGMKGDYSYRPNDQHLIKTGFQFQASRSDGTVSIETAQTNPLGGAPIRSAITDSTPNTGYFESIYAQDDYSITKSLILNAGVRFDATQFDLGDFKPSEYLFQPRIGLNYLLTETTKLHAFYGKLFQPAPVENLRYSYDPTTGRFNQLTTYDIKAEKDDYFEVGVAQQFFKTHVAMVNVYYKDGKDVLDDSQIGNTSIAQPYNYAVGYAYGAELSFKGQLTDDWSDFANYSYAIAKGKGGESISESVGYVFLDHTQKHTANFGLTYQKNYLWWTTQGLYGSGLRTGPYNSINLPGHFTMDTTVGYQFHGKSWLSQFRLSGDILNIFDNVYPITIANGFNGSHYAAGRQFFVRLAKSF